MVSRWIPHAGKDVWGILEEVNFSTSRAMCVNAGPGERSRDTHTHWPDRVHWSGRGLTLDLSRRDRPRSWESEFKSQPEPRHHDNPEVRVLNLTLEELQTDQRFPSGLAHYPSPWPHQGSVRQPAPFCLLLRCRTNETVTLTGSRENVLTKNTEA